MWFAQIWRSEPNTLQENIPRPTSDLAFISVLNLRPILELIPILIGLLRDLVFELQDFDTEILQPVKLTSPDYSRKGGMDKGADEIKAMASRATGASKANRYSVCACRCLGLDEVIGGAFREKLISTSKEKRALSCSVANGEG
jgi:hypothetical protein